MTKRVKSSQTFQSMCKVIPGGVNSPVRTCQSMGQDPMIVSSGLGDLLTDLDGHDYIDFCCSWGALIHGHSNPVILKALQERIVKGTSFGITTAVEGELAQLVTTLMPNIEKIRFVSSGTEATMTAARLARGFTGKEWIVKFSGHYHGHADFFLVQAGSGVFNLSPSSSSAGIPEEIVKYTYCLPFNDPQALKNFFNEPKFKNRIAAVILEPVAGNIGVVPADAEFIRLVREETEKAGALLIFDEVITGFRVGIGGAQDYYRVKPDLTCLGKIVGGGFPAAAFGGRADIMDFLAPLGPVYQAGTLSGNPLAMEAGLQSLKLLTRPGFYEELQAKTDRFLNPVRECIAKHQLNACVQQVGSMFTLFLGRKSVRNSEEAKELDKNAYASLFRFLFSRGIYIPPAQQEAWFITSAHTEEHLDQASKIVCEWLEGWR